MLTRPQAKAWKQGQGLKTRPRPKH